MDHISQKKKDIFFCKLFFIFYIFYSINYLKIHESLSFNFNKLISFNQHKIHTQHHLNDNTPINTSYRNSSKHKLALLIIHRPFSQTHTHIHRGWISKEFQYNTQVSHKIFASFTKHLSAYRSHSSGVDFPRSDLIYII